MINNGHADEEVLRHRFPPGTHGLLRPEVHLGPGLLHPQDPEEEDPRHGGPNGNQIDGDEVHEPVESDPG